MILGYTLSHGDSHCGGVWRAISDGGHTRASLSVLCLLHSQVGGQGTEAGYSAATFISVPSIL